MMHSQFVILKIQPEEFYIEKRNSRFSLKILYFDIHPGQAQMSKIYPMDFVSIKIKNFCKLNMDVYNEKQEKQEREMDGNSDISGILAHFYNVGRLCLLVPFSVKFIREDTNDARNLPTGKYIIEPHSLFFRVKSAKFQNQ